MDWIWKDSPWTVCCCIGMDCNARRWSWPSVALTFELQSWDMPKGPVFCALQKLQAAHAEPHNAQPSVQPAEQLPLPAVTSSGCAVVEVVGTSVEVVVGASVVVVVGSDVVVGTVVVVVGSVVVVVSSVVVVGFVVVVEGSVVVVAASISPKVGDPWPTMGALLEGDDDAAS